MSKFANKIKNYYERGMWDRERVLAALTKSKITQAEYDIIIGE